MININANIIGSKIFENRNFSPLSYLTSTATSHCYYDFRELVADSGVAILDNEYFSNILRDLSGNGRTLTLSAQGGYPQTLHLLSNADVLQDIIAYRNNNTSSRAILPVTGSTFFTSSFSVNVGFRVADGRIASAYHIAGTYNGTHYGAHFRIDTAGTLTIRHQGFTWLSDSAVIPDGATGLIDIDAHFDFESDTLTVRVNGVVVTGTFTVGSISSTDPTQYGNTTRNIIISNFNNNGSIGTNAADITILYYSITKLQTETQQTEVRNYLHNRKATFQLVSVLTDASYILFPHDLVISSDGTKAYVSSKGADVSELVDGAFAVLDITDPENNLSVLGGYNGTNDQIDGETVIEVTPDIIYHFVSGAVVVLDVSNPASPVKVTSLSLSSDVVNGVVRIGDYLFGANKGGTIDVVNVSNPSAPVFTGAYTTTTDLVGTGPHDIDVMDDGEHIVIVARETGADPTYNFAVYKVFNAGNLIPIGSWVYAGRLSNANLAESNRVRVVSENRAFFAGDPNVGLIDLSNVASPTLIDTFNVTTFSSGVTRYNSNYVIASWQVGVRMFSLTNPLVQVAGYYNDTTFATGNASWHDMKVFTANGNTYLLITAQSDSKIVCLKINKENIGL